MSGGAPFLYSSTWPVICATTFILPFILDVVIGAQKSRVDVKLCEAMCLHPRPAIIYLGPSIFVLVMQISSGSAYCWHKERTGCTSWIVMTSRMLETLTATKEML